MAQRLPQTLWSTRDLVDRLARQSPARLALGVFDGVIAVVTGVLSTPRATADGTRAPFRRRAVHRDVGDVRDRAGHGADRHLLVDRGQVPILVAIKIGGLGMMTLASLLGLAGLPADRTDPAPARDLRDEDDASR